MRTLASLLCLVALGACSTSLSTTELGNTSDKVNGLPFRSRDQFVVELYELTSDGYKKVAQNQFLLADPEHVYVLHFNGQAFADAKIQVDLFGDSTLKVVSLDSENKADEALTSLGSGFKETASAIADLEKKQQTASKTVRTEAESASVEEFTDALSLQQAITAVDVAEQELLEMSPAELPSRRFAKEGAILALKLKANEAARKAGAPAPY